MLNPDSALADWNVRKARATAHAAGLRTYLALVAIGTVVSIVAQVKALTQPDSSHLPVVLLVLAEIVLLGWALWGIVINPAGHLRHSAGQLTTPSESLQARLQEILSVISARLGVDRQAIHTRIALRQLGAGPSVVCTGGAVELILPLGFFKLLSTDREAARAILAHELAHCAQNDSAEWLRASAFSRFARGALLPLVCLQFVAAVLAVQRIEAERANTNTESLYDWSVMSRYQPGRILWTVDPNPVALAKAGVISRSFLSLLMIVALASYVRRMRRNSESMADLAAGAIVGYAPLERALLATHPPARQREIFDTHPDLHERLRYLAQPDHWTSTLSQGHPASRLGTGTTSGPDVARDQTSGWAHPFRDKPGAVFLLCMGASLATIIVQAGFSMRALAQQFDLELLCKGPNRLLAEETAAMEGFSSQISPYYGYLPAGIEGPGSMDSLDRQAAEVLADSAAVSQFWAKHNAIYQRFNQWLNRPWIAGDDSTDNNRIVSRIINRAAGVATLEHELLRVKADQLSFLKSRVGKFVAQDSSFVFNKPSDQDHYSAMVSGFAALEKERVAKHQELNSLSDDLLDSIAHLPLYRCYGVEQ